MWELSTDQGARYITDWAEVEPLLDQLDNKTHAYLSLALEDGTRYITSGASLITVKTQQY